MFYENASIIRFKSKVLQGNPLGDPSEREILVFEPEKLVEGSPLLLGLAGFGGGARSFLNFSPMSLNFTDIVSKLRRNQKLHNAVIAIPDCYTSFGGNQYINAPLVGNYEDFIIRELLPYLKERCNTGYTGVFGKSSGGFGAYSLAIRHPRDIHGFADHSGDAGFEYCYLPDFPDAVREFERTGGPAKWYQDYLKLENRTSTKLMKTINVLAMSAFYTHSKTSGDMGIAFPFDLKTGELLPEIWNKWKELDPAENIAGKLDLLSGMKAVYLDVGTSDEFNINFGMRKMHRILEQNSVEHEFHEFDAGHFNITYRYEKSLEFLAEKLEK